MIYYHFVQFVANPMIIADTQMIVFNDTKGVSRFNSSFLLKYDAEKVQVSALFMGKTNEASKEFDKLYLRGKLDACNIEKGMLGVFVGRVLQNLLLQFSNFQFTCPIKKGFYRISRLPPVNDNQLPTYILGFSGPFQFTQTIKGRINNTKALEHLLTIKITGFIEPRQD